MSLSVVNQGEKLDQSSLLSERFAVGQKTMLLFGSLIIYLAFCLLMLSLRPFDAVNLLAG